MVKYSRRFSGVPTQYSRSRITRIKRPPIGSSKLKFGTMKFNPNRKMIFRGTYSKPKTSFGSKVKNFFSFKRGTPSGATLPSKFSKNTTHGRYSRFRTKMRSLFTPKKSTTKTIYGKTPTLGQRAGMRLKSTFTRQYPPRVPPRTSRTNKIIYGEKPTIAQRLRSKFTRQYPPRVPSRSGRDVTPTRPERRSMRSRLAGLFRRPKYPPRVPSRRGRGEEQPQRRSFGSRVAHLFRRPKYPPRVPSRRGRDEEQPQTREESYSRVTKDLSLPQRLKRRLTRQHGVSRHRYTQVEDATTDIDEEDIHPMKKSFRAEDRYAGAQKVMPTGGQQDSKDERPSVRPPIRPAKKVSRYVRDEPDEDEDEEPTKKSRGRSFLKGLGKVGSSLGRGLGGLAPSLLTSIPSIIQTSQMLQNPRGVDVDVRVEDDDDAKIAALTKQLEELKKRRGEEPADEEPADEEPADEEPADEEPADEEPVDDEFVDTVRPGLDTHDDNYLDKLERRGIDVEDLVRRYGQYYV